MDPQVENENIEARLLLEAVYLKYGYDFRNYSMASIKRRIKRRMGLCGAETVSEMTHRLLNDEAFFSSVLADFSINVTEMFRDPPFYRTVRARVAPELRKMPFFKVWHAGCATGEEVFSMAILLQEEGLYDSARIYATDFNEEVIRNAKEGIYPIDRMKEYTHNYHKSGGKASFADYYTARYDFAIMNASLKENIIFADHNLVTDGVFGEMNLILCRNVLIYFDRQLQNRVIGLFYESLPPGGLLCLGSKESIRFCEYSDRFEDVDSNEKIYRKRA